MLNFHKIINMNPIRKSLIIILFFLITASPVFSQEKAETIDLKRLADNTKFENAMQFFNLKRYDIALQGFNEYLEIYPNGIHRIEAYKKIAGIHFERFNYVKAIKIYRSLHEEFSNSSDGIEAFYNVGICFCR